jgi:capsid portal protein
MTIMVAANISGNDLRDLLNQVLRNTSTPAPSKTYPM